MDAYHIAESACSYALDEYYVACRKHGDAAPESRAALDAYMAAALAFATVILKEVE